MMAVNVWLFFGNILIASYVSPIKSLENNKMTDINFLLLLPFEIEGQGTQPWYTGGPTYIPAVNMAVDQINEMDDILPGYRLNFTVANSACNLKDHTAVNFLSTYFHKDVRFAGIVGPVCSDAVSYLSPIFSQDLFAVINFHIANSPHFSEHVKFKYAFGTAGSAHSVVITFINLMKEEDWKSVAVLYEESITVFRTSYDVFVRELPKIFPEGHIAFSSPISHTYIPLSSVLDHNIRIVLVMGTPTMTNKLSCLIWKNRYQFTFPIRQFVFFGVDYHSILNNADFILNNQHYVCSAKDIKHAVRGFFLTDLGEVGPSNNTKIVSGITYGEYHEEYCRKIDCEKPLLPAEPVYDGVWSLILALNSSIPKLREIGLNLTDLTYGQKKATDLITEEIIKLSFQGASGPVSFDNKTRFTKIKIDVKQVFEDDSVIVLRYDENKNTLTHLKEAVFIDDSFKVKEVIIARGLAGFFLFILFMIAMSVVALHVVTLVFYNYSAVKASSFRLIQLVFVGCYCVLVVLLCFTIQSVTTSDETDKTLLCILQAWTLPIGLTLILSTVAAKTWRLYCIFVQLKKPGIYQRDCSLVILVLLLVAVDVVLCSAWTAGFNFTVVQTTKLANDDDIEVTVRCGSDHYYAWFGTLAIYHTLMMLTALLFALLTRKIKHKSFNTKPIILLVYCLAICLFVGFPLYLVLNNSQVSGVNVQYIVLSLTYLGVVVICVVFLFFPPVLILLREKAFHKIPGLKKYSTEVGTKSSKISSFMIK